MVEEDNCVLSIGYLNLSDMAVATLPIIGTPPFGFFLFLDFLPVAALLIVVILWQLYLAVTAIGRCYSVSLYAMFLNFKIVSSVGDFTCVKLFPNLFKKHKQCTQNTVKVFITFLDRDIEDHLGLKGAFYSLAFSILTASVLVFFRLFPVAVSGECLEKDGLLRPLFCYTDQSSYPIDCTTYTNNVTAMASNDTLPVICYALSTNVGLAVAAAVGFAGLVASLVTVYVRASEYWFEKDWNLWCHFILSWIAFFTVTCTACAYATLSIGGKIGNSQEATGQLVARFAYLLLPVFAFFPFLVIMARLYSHCEQQQYSSLCPDQEPEQQRRLSSHSFSNGTNTSM